MIFQIYMGFMLIALILIIMGYYFQDIVCTIIGFSILFMINAIVVNPGISYETGTIVDTVGTQKIITYTYDQYENKTLYIVFCFIGVLGATYFGFDKYKERYSQ